MIVSSLQIGNQVVGVKHNLVQVFNDTCINGSANRHTEPLTNLDSFETLFRFLFQKMKKVSLTNFRIDKGEKWTGSVALD